MEGDKKYKKTISVLSTLLGVSIVALAGTEMYKQYVPKKTTSVIVEAENIITSEEKSKIDNTTKQQANDNDTFNIVNMFPGDTVTKNYCIKVSYKDSVTVRFGVDTHNGYEKLSEAMKIKVVLSTTGEILYDDYIKDMPTSLNHTLSFTDTSKNEELYYKVTAYLDTSVGNEYLGKDLKLNFKWWVEEDNNLQTLPDTGGKNNIFILISAMVVSFSGLRFLCSKRRKAVESYG